jgi:transposase
MDMGKNTLHMIGLDSRGAIVLREKVSRGRITSRLANLPPCLIPATTTASASMVVAD